MTYRLKAGSSDCSADPLPVKKEIIADKNSSHLYVRCTWYPTNNYFGPANWICRLLDSSGASITYIDAGGNQNGTNPIIKNWDFNISIIAGAHYFVQFEAIACGYIFGISDISISTDPIT